MTNTRLINKPDVFTSIGSLFVIPSWTMMNSRPSSFEDLPEDIFVYEIFPLFSMPKLFYSFANLNERLNGLLRSVKHLKYHHSSESQSAEFVLFFASVISHLTVSDGAFDIQPYRSVKTLILKYPTARQRTALKPDVFPWLRSLSLSYPLTDPDLLYLIFSNGLPNLNTCRLDRIKPSDTWTGSPGLLSLTVSVHGRWETICVLRACPNLVQLDLVIYMAQFSSLPLPKQSVPCLNSALRKLTITAKLDIVRSLLSIFPNLEQLMFHRFDGYSGRSPGRSLTTFLHTRQLDLILDEDDDSSS